MGTSFSYRAEQWRHSASCTGVTFAQVGTIYHAWNIWDKVMVGQGAANTESHALCRKTKLPWKMQEFCKDGTWSLIFPISEGPRLWPASQTLAGSQLLGLVVFRWGPHRKPRGLSAQSLALFNNIHLNSLYFHLIWSSKGKKIPWIFTSARADLAGDRKENAQPGNIPKLEADLKDWAEKYLHWI